MSNTERWPTPDPAAATCHVPLEEVKHGEESVRCLVVLVGPRTTAGRNARTEVELNGENIGRRYTTSSPYIVIIIVVITIAH